MLNRHSFLQNKKGGIGAQAKALEILGADFEHYHLVEWAVNSIIGYNAIHIKDFADHSEGSPKHKNELFEKAKKFTKERKEDK